MKKALLIILSLLPYLVAAQVNTKIQKGYVRMQSFVNKIGERVVGARIYQSENEENPVYSVSTPEEGYFELSLTNTDALDVYHISSVKGPKGTQYRVLYPQPDDRLEYTPSAPLTIVMQSNKELDDYATYVKKMAIEEANKNFEAEKARLQRECELGQINNIEKDSIIESLQSKLNNYENFVYDYIREDLQKWDFELLDERHKEISIAMETGNYSLADSLLKWRTDKERLEEYNNAVKNNEEAQKIAASTNEIVIKTRNGILFEKNKIIDLALQELDFDEAIYHMKDRLYYDSTNVTYLCGIGEMYEIHYNNYSEALSYYSKALRYASDDVTRAICLNHIGDVNTRLCEHNAALANYENARLLLEPLKNRMSKNLYDSYLGLGNVSFELAKYSESNRYYKKCTAKLVKTINSKAYWQGRIGVARIKLVKGKYHDARADFSSILKETTSIHNFDIPTISMAYGNFINCLITTGQYQEAIDLCNTAIKFIESRSTPKNTYIANTLAQQGSTYIGIGKFKEGEECYNKAIDIYQNILGKEHPDYANACIMFANYYTLVGNFKKSEDMSLEALELMNKKYGKNHTATIGAHYSLFELHRTCYEIEKAQARLDTIKTIFKTYGVNYDQIKSQLNTKESYLKIIQGETDGAIDVMHKAVDAITRTYGKDAVQLISIYTQMADLYFQQSENEKAKTYLDKAQALANKIYGNNSPNAIMQQMGYGTYYCNKGEYHKAYELYTNIENVVKDIFGEDNYQSTTVYLHIGDYHLMMHEYDLAKQYYDKCYNITKETFGENHHYIATPISRLGKYSMRIDDYDGQLAKAKQTYEILSSYFGIGHKSTLLAQLDICTAHINLWQYKEAEQILIRLTKDIVKKFGKDHWTHLSILHIKAKLHQSKEELNEAIDCINEIIEILEKKNGEKHLSTLQQYELLSILHKENCNFKKAIEYNDITIAIATKFYGKDHVGTMPFILEKANLYTTISKNKEAHQLCDKVKDIYISTYGDSCRKLFDVISLEATLLMQEGKGEKAITTLNEALEQKQYDSKSAQHFMALYSTLGDAYMQQGDFDKVKECYDKMYDIVAEKYGKEHHFVAYAISKQGLYYLNTGDLNEALASVKKVYGILSSYYGDGHKITLRSLIDMCSIYIQLGEFDQVEIILSRLSKEIVKKFGKGHWTYSNIQNIQSTLHQSRGEIKEAIECALEAIAIIEKDYGKHHIQTLSLYQRVGDMYNNICNLKKAIEYNDIAISIASTFFGKDKSGVMPYLLKKGELYTNLGRNKEAHQLFDKIKNTYIREFGDSCRQLSHILISEADLLINEGKVEKAIEILEGVKKQLTEFYGEEHIHMCATYNILANAYLLTTRYDYAREYYQKSLDITQKKFGKNSMNCIVPLIGLANVCYYGNMTGSKFDEAMLLYKSASRISTSIYGSNNLNTSHIDALIGTLSLRNNNLNDAYNRYKNNLDIVKKTFGKSHTKIAEAENYMGQYYIAKANEAMRQQDSVGVSNYAMQAMKRFNSAKNMINEIYGEEHFSTSDILSAISQTYMLLQESDSAIAIGKKSAELKIKTFGKDSPITANAYASLADIYLFENKLDFFSNFEILEKARDSYLKAISIRQNITGDTKENIILSTMNWRFNLSTVYMQLLNYDDAFETIDKIIEELDTLQLENKYVYYNSHLKKASMIYEKYVYMNTKNTYGPQRKYDAETEAKEAFVLLQKAEGFFQASKIPNKFYRDIHEANYWNIYGNIYRMTNDKENALKSYEKALKCISRYQVGQVSNIRLNIENNITELMNE